MARTGRDIRAVQIALASLGAVPVATGLFSVIGGPAVAPGGEQTNASIDSEYRFLNLFWTAAGVLLWWSLRDPVARSSVTRLVLGLASLGGLPRLLSWARVGAPHPVFRGTLVLELVIVPVLLVWHGRVVTRHSDR